MNRAASGGNGRAVGIGPSLLRGIRMGRDDVWRVSKNTDWARNCRGLDNNFAALQERALSHPFDGVAVWVHGDVAPGNLLMTDGHLASRCLELSRARVVVRLKALFGLFFSKLPAPET